MFGRDGCEGDPVCGQVDSDDCGEKSDAEDKPDVQSLEIRGLGKGVEAVRVKGNQHQQRR